MYNHEPLEDFWPEGNGYSCHCFYHEAARTGSFKDFSRLPYELRIQIWTLAVVNSPRIVYLEQYSVTDVSRKPRSKPKRSKFRFRSSAASSHLPPNYPSDIAYRSPCCIPAFLSACSESRAVALPFYTLAFGTKSAPPTTFISFEYDTLYISYDTFIASEIAGPWGIFHLALEMDLVKVKHLMFGGVWTPFLIPATEWDFITRLFAVLEACGGLEKVTLVNDSLEQDKQDLVVVNARCPFKCWEAHDGEDEESMICRGILGTQRTFLENYGDFLLDQQQQPPELKQWPTFLFRTLMARGTKPDELNYPKPKVWELLKWKWARLLRVSRRLLEYVKS